MSQPLDRFPLFRHFRIVLVEPQLAANVGACARVAACFNLSDLRIIAPHCDWKSLEAEKLATGSSHQVLLAAREHSHLLEAVQDCTQVIGFTEKQFRDRTPVVFSQLSPWSQPQGTDSGPIALVFGNERVGLSLEQLTYCTELATIPTSPEMPSLNLSHAVAIVAARLYEQATDVSFPVHKKTEAQSTPATVGELHDLLNHWRDCLADLGFTQAGNPERMTGRIRQILIERAGTPLSRSDVQLLRGFLSRTQQSAAQNKS